MRYKREEKIFIFKRIEAAVYYTFLHSRNHDTSWEENVNKGEYLEATPEHHVIVDLSLTFTSLTSLSVWGYSEINQVMYRMRFVPAPDVTGYPYSRKFFETEKMHNPVMLNIKVSQEIKKHFTLYFLCRNIFDDFRADPFNPGPGRMFYGGVNIKY